MIRLLVTSYLRFVVRAPYSSLSVVLGVLLGVASVTGVHLLGERVNASLDALRPPHLAAVTHLATHNNLSVARYAELLEARASGRLEGIAALRPMLEGTLPDGTRVVATDWLQLGAPRASMQLELAPEALMEAAIVRGFEGVTVGNRVRVGHRTLVVAGELATSELTGEGRVLFTDLSVGAALLGRDDLDAVLLRVDDPQQRLRDALELLMPGMSAGLSERDVVLGDGWQVRGVTQEVAGFALARAVLFNVGALGSLSLLVALLLMYQTCVIWLRRQRPILDRLHEIGVGAGLLLSAFLVALLVIGTVATGLGLFAGRALASSLLNQMALGADSGLALSAALIIKAGGAGLGVCLAGGAIAWWVEWRAAAPIRWPWVVGVGLLLAVASVLLLQVSEGLLGAFAAIFVIAALVCWVSLPVLGGLRGLANRVRSALLVRLALRESTWYAGDLSLAVSALALALGVSIGVGLMVDSFRRDFLNMLELRLQAELYLAADQAQTDTPGWLSAAPGVTRVVAYGSDRVRAEGRQLSVGYARVDARKPLGTATLRPLPPVRCWPASARCAASERWLATMWRRAISCSRLLAPTPATVMLICAWLWIALPRRRSASACASIASACSPIEPKRSARRCCGGSRSGV